MRVAELFYSIQGEGTLAGVPSVFIRLAGCPLHCRWCDTPYSRLPGQGRLLAPASIAEAVDAAGSAACRHVVITGGEPTAARSLAALTRLLARRGLHVTIETAAIDPPPPGLHCDLASLSPKLQGSAPSARLEKARYKAHEARRLNRSALEAWLHAYPAQLKFVIRTARDVEETLDCLRRLSVPPAPDRILLMPEGVTVGALNRHAALALDACRRHGFRFCDRLHIRLFGHQRGV